VTVVNFRAAKVRRYLIRHLVSNRFPWMVIRRSTHNVARFPSFELCTIGGPRTARPYSRSWPTRGFDALPLAIVGGSRRRWSSNS
jgi:hypothetical protein